MEKGDELRKTLNENCGIFALPGDVLGWMYRVQHCVDNLESAPIKQCLCKVPISRSNIAETKIQKMLDHGD